MSNVISLTQWRINKRKQQAAADDILSAGILSEEDQELSREEAIQQTQTDLPWNEQAEKKNAEVNKKQKSERAKKNKEVLRSYRIK